MKSKLITIALLSLAAACGSSSPAPTPTTSGAEATGPQRDGWRMAANGDVVSDPEGGPTGMVMRVTLAFTEDGNDRSVEVDRYDLDCQHEGCGSWARPDDPEEQSSLTETANSNMPAGALASVLVFQDDGWRAYYLVPDDDGYHVQLDQYANEDATSPSETRQLPVTL